MLVMAADGLVGMCYCDKKAGHTAQLVGIHNVTQVLMVGVCIICIRYARRQSTHVYGSSPSYAHTAVGQVRDRA